MPAKTNAFAAKLPLFHRALKRWYAEHGRRDLPWRNTREPYRIYLSEIMLQQTQVKTVLERYYGPFLKRFPTLAALAKAKREEVMKAWEGLGYYTRAANLHAAAKRCKGQLPGTWEALLELPGIGRNTAHAVACFAFGAKLPVMEANVKRVLCRVFALKKADDATLFARAEELLDAKNVFNYNQAMMDIGATVCTKRAPRCDICPATVLCKGKSSPESYPAPKKAKAIPVRKRILVVFHDGQGRYYLKQRASRFLGGLYGFMEYEPEKPVTFMGKRHALKDAQLLGAVTQTYSHFQMQAKVYVAFAGKQSVQAASLEEMKALPLSKADHKVVMLLKEWERAQKLAKAS